MASMHAASAPVRAVRTPAGDPAWLVSGYDEVRALIADSRLSWTTSAAGASRYSQAAAMVICEVLGVPPQDRTEFRIWSDEAACTTDRDRAQAGRDQLHTYMAALIEDKRAHPGQDVHTDLVAAADAQGHDPQKVVVRLAAGLLFAGHETTVGAKIGLIVDSLQIQSIDDQDVGYIQAMAAPHNAAIQREAQIAQARANQAAAEAQQESQRNNVIVLNGTDGLGDLTAGLISQGLRIFDSVRQNLGNDAPGTAPAMGQDGDR
ncbi:hypothetical protein [Pseudonocardia xinjiangensis]|uniref:hypothetical protein n=1 Tax=Pseudonocardia xinjiangensis TaxID=75289 RepID=UPI001FE66547|nr:hypothetical protein [Pseudonocardia xinjiangensis]